MGTALRRRVLRKNPGAQFSRLGQPARRSQRISAWRAGRCQCRRGRRIQASGVSAGRPRPGAHRLADARGDQHHRRAPRRSGPVSPIARSTRVVSFRPWCWRTARRSARFSPSGTSSKRFIRRRLYWDRRRKTRRWLQCRNGAPSSRALPPSWRAFETLQHG
jgi:hypothetical protein